MLCLCLCIFRNCIIALWLCFCFRRYCCRQEKVIVREKNETKRIRVPLSMITISIELHSSNKTEILTTPISSSGRIIFYDFVLNVSSVVVRLLYQMFIKANCCNGVWTVIEVNKNWGTFQGNSFGFFFCWLMLNIIATIHFFDVATQNQSSGTISEPSTISDFSVWTIFCLFCRIFFGIFFIFWWFFWTLVNFSYFSAISPLFRTNFLVRQCDFQMAKNYDQAKKFECFVEIYSNF